MIDICITGDIRTIAESAWISTLDEASAKKRTDGEVLKVVRYLIDNMHTSPFESVTLSFSFLGDSSLEPVERKFYNMIQPYADSRYSRVVYCDNSSVLTIDLLNFLRVTKNSFSSFEESSLWSIFSIKDPLLSSVVARARLWGEKLDNSIDAGHILGKHDMKVELISYHKNNYDSNSRATWRVYCPLSIAVQILRHRTGSFNMVSGRYRTINQSMVSSFYDVSCILNKIYCDGGETNSQNKRLEDYFSKVNYINNSYKELMILARKSKKNDIISNSEYKRLREVARYVLPEGRMTSLYITFYIDDFKRYLNLRNSAHAQVEHMWVAQEMSRALTDYSCVA